MLQQRGLIFIFLVFGSSLLAVIMSLKTTPIALSEVSPHKGKIAFVECSIYNKVKYIYLSVDYNDGNILVEGVPHSLSNECDFFSSNNNNYITLYKARNYIVGVEVGEKTILSVNKGMEEANNSNGLIFFMSFICAVSFLIMVFRIRKVKNHN